MEEEVTEDLEEGVTEDSGVEGMGEVSEAVWEVVLE